MNKPAIEGLRYRAHHNHRDHGALLAVSPHDGQGVGVARYLRCPHDRESAEVAIALSDEWQGGGLEHELFRRLAEHVRGQGIRRCTAVLPADDVSTEARVVTLVRTEDDTLACEVGPR